MAPRHTRHRSRQCNLARGKVSEPEVIRIPELDAIIASGYKPQRPATEHDKAVLRAYYGKVSLRAIARTLGRTLSTVGYWVDSLGLKGGKP